MANVRPAAASLLELVLVYLLAAFGWLFVFHLVTPIFRNAPGRIEGVYFVQECALVLVSALILFCFRRYGEARKLDDPESSLKRMVWFLRAANEHDRTGVAVLNERGSILYLNPAFERMSGHGRSEMLGRDISGLLDSHPKEEIFRWMKDSIRHGEGFTGRFAVGPYEIDGGATSLRDEAGVVHYVLMIRDVTREVLLERQLRKAQKMEAIGALAGGIAHDFNNILGIVLTCTEMALDDTAKDCPIREDLEHVLKAGKRGKSLIRKILTFSRADEQKLAPSPIGPMVREGLKLIRTALPANIEIRQETACGQGLVLADSVQIYQILMNLCTNAAHAMGDRGGLLDVRLEAVEMACRAERASSDLRPGPYAKLTVSDNGHGMEPEILQRIFDPLFTTKEDGTGTGLGLPVVLGIVKSHKGIVMVESEPGKGTAFHVFLPRIQRGEDFPGNVSTPSAPRSHEKALLIDEEVNLVHAGEKMPRRLCCEVENSSTRPEALELFRAQPDRFDLVITDQRMPKMRGADPVKGGLTLQPGIPVILCTGLNQDPEEGIPSRQAQTIGIREVLMKPLERSETAEGIRRILDQGKSG